MLIPSLNARQTITAMFNLQIAQEHAKQIAQRIPTVYLLMVVTLTGLFARLRVGIKTIAQNLVQKPIIGVQLLIQDLYALLMRCSFGTKQMVPLWHKNKAPVTHLNAPTTTFLSVTRPLNRVILPQELAQMHSVLALVVILPSVQPHQECSATPTTSVKCAIIQSQSWHAQPTKPASLIPRVLAQIFLAVPLTLTKKVLVSPQIQFAFPQELERMAHASYVKKVLMLLIVPIAINASLQWLAKITACNVISQIMARMAV